MLSLHIALLAFILVILPCRSLRISPESYNSESYSPWTRHVYVCSEPHWAGGCNLLKVEGNRDANNDYHTVKWPRTGMDKRIGSIGPDWNLICKLTAKCGVNHIGGDACGDSEEFTTPGKAEVEEPWVDRTTGIVCHLQLPNSNKER